MKKKIVCILSALFISIPAASALAAAEIEVHSTTISAGGYHCMAVTEDGSLYTWGNNRQGQLGVGTTEDAYTPQKIMDNVISVHAANNNSMAITADGSLYIWGENYSGCISDTAPELITSPLKVMDNVVSAGIGNSHVAVLTADGSLYTWGSNLCGQLGNGTTEDAYTPQKIMDNIVSVGAGFSHTMATTAGGDMYIWGSNSFGQLGNGSYDYDLYSNQPTPIKLMDNIDSVCANGDTSMAVTKGGELYAWGYNEFGKLGAGTFKYIVGSPQKVMDDVVSVSTGNTTTMIITKDESLYACGYNYCGQIGDGTTASVYTPKKIMDDVAAACGGWTQSMALTADGSLYTWGGNGYGEMGIGTHSHEDKYTAPQKLMDNIMLPKIIKIGPSEWAEDGIDSAGELGLIPSELDGAWLTPVTRLDFCRLIYSLCNNLNRSELGDASTATFNDTDALTESDKELIACAAGLDIVNGYEDGSFRPNNLISREEAAVMLARTARRIDTDEAEITPHIFADHNEISDWAKEDTAFVSSLDIMNGILADDGSLKFNPHGSYTREQAVLTFLRLYNTVS